MKDLEECIKHLFEKEKALLAKKMAAFKAAILISNIFLSVRLAQHAQGEQTV